MLRIVHLLLTYKCPLRCNHCYVFGNPTNEGQLTPSKINRLLEQAKQLSTIEWIIFEGGEPFLFYPLLLNSVQKARKLGFKVGVFTNGFFARTDAAATRYLIPLAKLKLDRLYISSDRFHYNTEGETPAHRAGRAACDLGIPVIWKRLKQISEQNISPIHTLETIDNEYIPLIMVGRAVEHLASQLPPKDPSSLKTCPNKGLSDPTRVSIDSSGNVQLCPGLAIGNVWESNLAEIIKQYTPSDHPICGPLLAGGPYLLWKSHILDIEGVYVDNCHLCYTSRRLLVDQFPHFLAPKNVYGIH